MLRLTSQGGAALVIDYGNDKIPQNTLRVRPGFESGKGGFLNFVVISALKSINLSISSPILDKLT